VDLKYGNTLENYNIAVVEGVEGKLPDFSGSYIANQDIPERIRDYINFCVRSWHFFEDQDWTDEYYREEKMYADIDDGGLLKIVGK
jgi:hypothetical protein